MRPKKIRWIKCDSQTRCFRPHGKSLRTKEVVVVSLDEFEAMRLLDLEELSQEEVAKKMRVHRSTISRISQSGHKKIMDALVQRKTLKIEGGCCKIVNGG